MKLSEFQRKIESSARPMVIDFWAPWCGPCRAMDPLLKETTARYVGKVDLIKVNVDESPEIASHFNIMGIPTTMAFLEGQQVYRKTGFQPINALENLFHSLAEGKTEIKTALSPVSRILRLSAGTVLIVFGIIRGPIWILIAVGGIVAFSAVYDRCPIYQALKKKIKQLLQKKVGSSV